MISPLIIGLMSEGPTDLRFLSSIIQRTFERIIFLESEHLPDIYDVQHVRPASSVPFSEKVLRAALISEQSGIAILCIHTDADDKNDKSAFEHKITPALRAISGASGLLLCRNLTPVVPVQMTEAWMLADIELLKGEIGTDKSNETLGLTRPPESIADPKAAIEDALRIALEDVPRRRRRCNVADLYLPIGLKLDLDRLALLPSYQRFKDAARLSLTVLNYFR